MATTNVKVMPKRVADESSQPRLPTNMHWQPFINVIIMVMMGAVFYVGAQWAINKVDQPLADIKIEADFHNLTEQTIQHALEPYVQTTFLNADLKQIQQIVKDLPWVNHVTVRRIWPNGLRLTI